MKIIEEIKRDKAKQEADQKKLREVIEKRETEKKKFLVHNFKDQKEIEKLRHEQ